MLLILPPCLLCCANVHSNVMFLESDGMIARAGRELKEDGMLSVATSDFSSGGNERMTT